MKATELAKQLDTDFRGTCARLDSDEPWFGRFTLRVENDLRPYKLGQRRVVDERILDWRHPLARAYYDASPGDEFELDTPGFAGLSGVVDSLAAITSRARTVRRVDLRTLDGKVSVVANDQGFHVPEGERRQTTQVDGLPDVLALLTPAQYRLITASRGNPVIIQGRAGSGKTTVALYRVAWLTFADEDAREPPVDASKVLIVMFNKALSSFVRTALAPLKLEAAQLDTFHSWALNEVRRSYRGLIEIDTSDRPGRAKASMLKKQMGLLRALEAFVQKQTRTLEAWLVEKLAPYGAAAWMKRYQALDTPVVRRLIALRAEALKLRDAAEGSDQQRLTQVHAVLNQGVARMTQYKEELLKLLSDQTLLSTHLPQASAKDIAALSAFQDAMQGDGGTDRRPGTKVAFEDLALLLRLIQLKHGGYPDHTRDDEVRVYDHLVVDEAQDFGAVELTALLASVRSRTGVTIVGDVNQKIVPDADFIGWDALAKELGVTGAQVARLEVAHRSTQPIMNVADSILGEQSEGGRPGAKPTLTKAQSEEALLRRIAELARADYEENRAAHVCIVCRNASDAAQLHKELAQELGELGAPVRLGHNKSFEFGPGITVSSSRQVKGLEFDSVIVVEASEKNYPATTDGKRALYMVTTRAKETLQFVGAHEPSSLLAEALRVGWIDVVSRATVPPVMFTADDDEPF